jgi:hypothetical protein
MKIADVITAMSNQIDAAIRHQMSQMILLLEKQLHDVVYLVAV